jgi:hypothetical protein
MSNLAAYKNEYTSQRLAFSVSEAYRFTNRVARFGRKDSSRGYENEKIPPCGMTAVVVNDEIPPCGRNDSASGGYIGNSGGFAAAVSPKIFRRLSFRAKRSVARNPTPIAPSARTTRFLPAVGMTAHPGDI